MPPSLQVHGACPLDCPDTCSVVTEVRDGRAVAFRGDPESPVTRGWLCSKVRPYLDHVYHPDRLMHPLKRVGAKGGGQWQRVSWDDALSEIAERWRAIIDQFGAEAILPYSYSGTLGLVHMSVASARFWNRLGASQLLRSICGAAAEEAVETMLGARWSPSYADVANSKLVILWGANPVVSGPHFMPFLQKAQKTGCKLVVIDPRRTSSAASADLHIAPRLGSDGVLALGIAHLLVAANRHDERWLNEHAVGWPQLRERLAEFPPERVVRECGINDSSLRELTETYASLRPGTIKIADGINRNRNGGENVRAILTLPALTGQYGKPGGGLQYSTGGTIRWDKLALNKILPTTRIVNMNRIGAALCGEFADPPIKSLFVFGANPATSSPNTAKIIEGLMRDDLFTVVHELFMTDTADYADLVLPATSQLEQTDLHKSYGHTSLTYNGRAIEPLGECKSNWETMGLLAKAMGFTEPWLYESADDVIAEVLAATVATHPWLHDFTLARLKAGGAVPADLGNKPPFADGQFPTASGKIELLSNHFSDPLPGRFRTDADDGANFGDPSQSLELLSAASHHFMSSSFANQAGRLDAAGPATVEIHPADASERGIKQGDTVIIENGRGSLPLQACVTTAVRRGVVSSCKGRWAKLSGGRHVNWTTPDALADLGGQSTFQSNRVWVRRA